MMTFELRDFEGEEREQFESLLNEIIQLNSLVYPGDDERWHKNLRLEFCGYFSGKLYRETSGFSSFDEVVAEADIQFFEDGIPLEYKEFTLFKTITKQVTVVACSKENAVEDAMEADNTAWVTVRQSNVEVGL